MHPTLDHNKYCMLFKWILPAARPMVKQTKATVTKLKLSESTFHHSCGSREKSAFPIIPKPIGWVKHTDIMLGKHWFTSLLKGVCTFYNYLITNLLNFNLKTYLMWSWWWNQISWQIIPSDMEILYRKHKCITNYDCDPLSKSEWKQKAFLLFIIFSFMKR